MTTAAELQAALHVLAETTGRGAFRRCAATKKIMFRTAQLGGRAARLMHARHGGRPWNVVRCGRNNHYHLVQSGDKA